MISQKATLLRRQRCSHNAVRQQSRHSVFVAFLTLVAFQILHTSFANPSAEHSSSSKCAAETGLLCFDELRVPFHSSSPDALMHLQLSIEDSLSPGRNTHEQSTSLLVSTTIGPVSGFSQRDTSASCWLGIPYAAAPTGSLRFRPPQPLTPRTTPLYAHSFAANCPVTDPAYTPVSEDCLYLNIFAPKSQGVRSKQAPAPSLLPVVVFFTSGASHPLHRHPTLTASKDIILVTANFRVGSLGFLYHPDLTAEAKTHGDISGSNMGFLDQVAALRWVSENIRSFGGDPNRVTLFSHSQFAATTCLHLVSPQSKGLFARAVLTSGSCFHGSVAQGISSFQPDFQATATSRFLRQLHCASEHAEQHTLNELDCLRKVPLEVLVRNEGFSTLQQPWHPVIDGSSLPADPIMILRSGLANPASVLVGTNTDEGAAYVAPSITQQQFQFAAYYLFGGHAAPQILQRYSTTKYGSPSASMANLLSDWLYHCPARRLLRMLPPDHVGFLYENSYVPSWTRCPGLFCAGPSSHHSLEQSLLWGVTPFGQRPSTTDQDESVRSQFLGAITSFVTSGAVSEWPEFRKHSPRLRSLSAKPSSLPDAKSSVCDFWDSLTQEKHMPLPVFTMQEPTAAVVVPPLIPIPSRISEVTQSAASMLEWKLIIGLSLLGAFGWTMTRLYRKSSPFIVSVTAPTRSTTPQPKAASSANDDDTRFMLSASPSMQALAATHAKWAEEEENESALQELQQRSWSPVPDDEDSLPASGPMPLIRSASRKLAGMLSPSTTSNSSGSRSVSPSLLNAARKRQSFSFEDTPLHSPQRNSVTPPPNYLVPSPSHKWGNTSSHPVRSSTPSKGLFQSMAPPTHQNAAAQNRPFSFVRSSSAQTLTVPRVSRSTSDSVV